MPNPSTIAMQDELDEVNKMNYDRNYDPENCPEHKVCSSALFRTKSGWLICTATSTNEPGFPGTWACGYRRSVE